MRLAAGYWLMYRRRTEYDISVLMLDPFCAPQIVRVLENRVGGLYPISCAVLLREDCKDSYVFVGPLPESPESPKE